MPQQTTTISLINMKGGVGKTTLAVNLAWHLCRENGHRVLLVDLDPQFNASQYTMDFAQYDRHRTTRGTVADLLLEPDRPNLAPRPAKKTAKKSRARTAQRAEGASRFVFERELTEEGGCLHILPSELQLARAVKSPHGIPYRLERELARIREEYDYIFIDCAPTDSVLTDTALMASDFILVPVRPDRFSILGFAQIQQVMETFKVSFHDPHVVQNLGVVFTQVTGNSPIEGECKQAIRAEADYVFETEIRTSNASYLRAVQDQTPVFDTRYARQLTRSAIRHLVSEIIDRIDELKHPALGGSQ